jgi:hypothetical protein
MCDPHYALEQCEERLRALEQRAEGLRAALEAIVGPTDSGPWIETYRSAGGGYQGLQAIAAAALAEWERES